jgi:ribonuclease HI
MYLYIDCAEALIGRGKKYLGEQSNNVAEYSGLILALQYAKDHGYEQLKVGHIHSKICDCDDLRVR